MPRASSEGVRTICTYVSTAIRVPGQVPWGMFVVFIPPSPCRLSDCLASIDKLGQSGMAISSPHLADAGVSQMLKLEGSQSVSICLTDISQPVNSPLLLRNNGSFFALYLICSKFS
jgi:hypothetical protein